MVSAALFKALAQLYDLVIFFTDARSVEGLEGVNYEVLKRPLKDSRTISLLQADVFVPGLILRLMAWDYDVVVGNVFDIATFVVAKIRRKPFILSSRRGASQRGRALRSDSLSPVVKFSRLAFAAVLVPSQMHKAETISLGAHGKKTFIMPNVSNIRVISSDYRNAEKLRSAFALNGKRAILYVGRLIESKGVPYLLEAFATLAAKRDDIVFVCVGEGPFKEQLELLSKELRVDDRVLFAGRVDMDLTRNAYLIPSFFCATSVWCRRSSFEGMPDQSPL